MRRYVSIAAVLFFLVAGIVCQFASRTVAQGGTTAQTPAVSPNPAETAAQEEALRRLADTNPLNCAACHGAGTKGVPYLAGGVFHRDAHNAYEQNIHGQAVRNGRRGATCLDCHSPNGSLETILPKSDPNSTVNRANVAVTCAKCHEQPAGTFRHSIHGIGQTRGVNVAATCSDCHGAHDIFPAREARSRMSRARTPETCAACHTTIHTDFEQSSHHTALLRGDARAPVCTNCHTAVSHSPAPVSAREFSHDTINQCAKCHEKQAPSYRDTFHGQATALGFKPAATCADCHTPHRNLPAADPRSSVNRANLIDTCGKCHTNEVSAGFVTYDPHPEPDNPNRSMLVYGVHTFMKWLFIFVFGFFGLHTLLWLQRSLVGLFRGETHRTHEGEQWVVRFNKSNRATHVVIVVSFLILAATGLPLMYYFTGWGQTLARLLGGVGSTRILHRIFAVVTFGYAFYHLGYLLWLIFFKRERGLLYGPDSMTPRPKDLLDLYRMLRWFFYKNPKPPKFDRWTYWEKFDYFAVFWGVPVIGLSGLLLWFPNFFSRLLPGEWLNVAMIVHGEEALLATGFIFAFHFFHNHMRPENFPLDTVIFTGKLPLRRFREERPREYRRLRKEGRLDEILTSPPTPRARLYATIFGFAAYIIGLILVVAIFATLLFGNH